MPHIHDNIDYAVETFIVYKDKVLLRKHDKYKMWMSIGGHIELEEDPNEAAVREAKEEVNLDIKLADDLLPPIAPTETYRDLIPPKFLNRNKISPNHDHVTLVYFATTESDQIRQNDTEVSDDIHWYTKEELDSPNCEVQSDVKFYALQALKELGK